MASIFLRKKTWWIQYSIAGRRIQHSLKVRDKRKAAHLKRIKEIEIEEGTAGVSSSTKRVDEFFQEYCNHIKVRKKLETCKHEMTHLILFSNLCPTLLKDVNAGTIQKFLTILAQRKKGSKPRTINSYLSHIKTFFKYAIECGYISKNPALTIKKLPEPKEPPRFLSTKELKAFITAAKKSHLYSMIMTGLYTGIRVGKLMVLRWEHINFKKNILTVFKAKGDKFRVIPLNSHLEAILAPLAKKDGLCFTYKDKGYSGQPRKALERVIREAKLQNVGWHTLRKTFASHLIINGTSITKVSKWLGHASPVITYQLYAHLAPTKDKDIDVINF